MADSASEVEESFGGLEDLTDLSNTKHSSLPEPSTEAKLNEIFPIDRLIEPHKGKYQFPNDPCISQPTDTTFFDQSTVQLDLKVTFDELSLAKPLMRAIRELGYVRPTKIQSISIPIARRGKDICGAAITGSGKTAAFLIPILERLLNRDSQSVAAIRVLILLPTRELAVQCQQVLQSLARYTSIRSSLAVGGLPLRPQEADLRSKPDIVIATPGRLIDHLTNSPTVTLASVEILVLDEADRMLEIGFNDELNEIIRMAPVKRQTMLFSATMTDDVQKLVRLSLNAPVKLFVDEKNAVAQTLTQQFIRIREHRESSRDAIVLALCKSIAKGERTIVFVPHKPVAHRLKIIFGLASLQCAELHGNLSQQDRLTSLNAFKVGSASFLVATDVASRGLDIANVNTVINYSMPAEYTTYLHRVGRTARAGAPGLAISLVGESDRSIMKEAIKKAELPSSQRVLCADRVIEYATIVESMEKDIAEILHAEQDERQLQKAEMELKKAENLILHNDEIISRPKRTWFQHSNKKGQLKSATKKAKKNK